MYLVTNNDMPITYLSLIWCHKIVTVNIDSEQQLKLLFCIAYVYFAHSFSLALRFLTVLISKIENVSGK